MNSKRSTLSIFTSFALFAIVAPAFGALLIQDVSVFLPGVTAQGNPSTTTGTNGTGKFYKETTTGLLVGFGSGVVPNASTKAATFTNRGLGVKDIFTGTWFKSTSDQQIVRVPVSGKSFSTILIIYNPSAVQ